MTRRMLPVAAASLAVLAGAGVLSVLTASRTAGAAEAAPPAAARPPATAPTSKPAAQASTAERFHYFFASLGVNAEQAIANATGYATAPDATPEQKQFAAWVDRHRDVLVNTHQLAWPGYQCGQSAFRPATADAPEKLFLYVLNHHNSGKVIAYGVAGDNVKRAYRVGDPKTDLKVEKTARDTIVELTAKNAKAPDPVATVVVLEFDGPHKSRDVAVGPRADGSFLLHASAAVVRGKNLRYEPEPNKDTLGYWTLPADQPKWVFEVEKAGDYEVEALQGCGKGSGGSSVEFVIENLAAYEDRPNVAALPMVVEDTGGFQAFVPRALGKVRLQRGLYSLAVEVKEKKGVAVMDLRQVTLKPVGR